MVHYVDVLLDGHVQQDLSEEPLTYRPAPYLRNCTCREISGGSTVCGPTAVCTDRIQTRPTVRVWRDLPIGPVSISGLRRCQFLS